LSPDDKSRIRTKDIFNHPWFKSFEKTESDENSDDSFANRKRDFEKKLNKKDPNLLQLNLQQSIKNDLDYFQNNINENQKSNFSSYKTGINSIKVNINNTNKMDLKKLKSSKSGISPSRDIEDLKNIENYKNKEMNKVETRKNDNDPTDKILNTKKKLISAKNDILNDILYGNSKNYDIDENKNLSENLIIEEKLKDNKSLKDKARRILEKNSFNKNGNLENLNKFDSFNTNINESKTVKSYHNSKMQKIVDKFSGKNTDKDKKNNKSPVNAKGRNLVQEILSGKISDTDKESEKKDVKKSTIDDENYDLDEFIQKEIFKFSEKNSSNNKNISIGGKIDKNNKNYKTPNKITNDQDYLKDNIMDLSIDKSSNDIVIDKLKDKINKQKDKSIINALNKTGDLINLDNEKENSIIDNVFSRIDNKNKKRRQSGNSFF
jgi:hypothetical protein